MTPSNMPGQERLPEHRRALYEDEIKDNVAEIERHYRTIYRLKARNDHLSKVLDFDESAPSTSDNDSETLENQ